MKATEAEMPYRYGVLYNKFFCLKNSRIPITEKNIIGVCEKNPLLPKYKVKAYLSAPKKLFCVANPDKFSLLVGDPGYSHNGAFIAGGTMLPERYIFKLK